MLSISTIAVGKLTGFILNLVVMVAVIGSILLIATLINKRITKKEQEQAEKDQQK
ncbi:MAG: hypothetical protein AB1Z23_02070 [Eubacteriales bacterium]